MSSNGENPTGTVLVIGGCGYLGSNLVRLLLKDPIWGSNVHVMSRNPTINIQEKANYHAGDISNGVQVTSILDETKPEVIFHTASPKYTDSEKLLRLTNVIGTKTLLKCASENPAVQAFVYTSTDSAIVPKPGHPLTEGEAELYTEHSNMNAYGRTKAMADAMVVNANGPDLRTAVIRIPNLYGENDDNCMGSLLKALKKGQQKVQVGEDNKNFEFVYIDNACSAHILAAKALVFPDERNAKVGGEAFFISDGISMPYFDFVRKIYAFAGHPVRKEEVQIMPFWVVLTFAALGEWLYWIFTLGQKQPDVRKLGIQHLRRGCEWDISKAKERLGYEPMDMDTVLKKTTEHEAKRLQV